MANCRPNIPEFISPECDFESGRIVGIAFIHRDIASAIYADPTNSSLWVDGDYASDLHVFGEVRGSYSGGSPIDVPGIGNQDTRVINADREITVAIQGVKSNEAFFNEIVKSHQYRVAFVVGGSYQTLFMNNVDTSIFAGAPVEEGLDSAVNWACAIKWKDINNPQSSDVPTGIFN
jgi:hypothetical protein